MTQLTIMLLVPDRARADMVLRGDRIYYHFATETTDDDGDLPGLQDRFDLVANRVFEALAPREGEKPVSADDIKVSMFVDNVARPLGTLTDGAVRRLVDQLTAIDDSLSFLNGFA